MCIDPMCFCNFLKKLRQAYKMIGVTFQTSGLFHGNFKEFMNKPYCPGPLWAGVLEIFSAQR